MHFTKALEACAQLGLAYSILRWFGAVTPLSSHWPDLNSINFLLRLHLNLRHQIVSFFFVIQSVGKLLRRHGLGTKKKNFFLVILLAIPTPSDLVLENYSVQ